MTITSFKYEMGLTAKDPVSEFQGIIISRISSLFGCSQYGLAPKIKDGSVGKTEYFDEARIEIIDNGIWKEGVKVNEFDEIFKYENGKEVKDKVTDFKGTIVYRLEFMNGCNQYAVLPKIDKDGKSSELEHFDEGRIEVIGDGIKPEEVTVAKRGGIINRDAPSK